MPDSSDYCVVHSSTLDLPIAGRCARLDLLVVGSAATADRSVFLRPRAGNEVNVGAEIHGIVHHTITVTPRTALVNAASDWMLVGAGEQPELRPVAISAIDDMEHRIELRSPLGPHDSVAIELTLDQLRLGGWLS